ncbi:MAG: hypothetical protein CVU44_01205 [Chloroflexi bacterium HGW-Chloroflexi-6]|nr:MAG: hypothetical protein CVU44_01205 [Chloroflexi bacterium HGW-Chloroflexi-6]
MIAYFAILTYANITDKVTLHSADGYSLFLGFGVAWPQIISRLIIQQKTESPIIFLKNKISILPAVMGFAFLLYLTIMMLQPNHIRVSDGEPIFDKLFFYSRLVFILAIIPNGILYFIFLIQRTAFCQNGLLYGGILIDWASIKTYEWKNEKLYDDSEMKPFVNKDTLIELRITTQTILLPKEIRLAIPHPQKEVLENLLNRQVSCNP